LTGAAVASACAACVGCACSGVASDLEEQPATNSRLRNKIVLIIHWFFIRISSSEIDYSAFTIQGVMQFEEISRKGVLGELTTDFYHGLRGLGDRFFSVFL
jgi:hypothetical protein